MSSLFFYRDLPLQTKSFEEIVQHRKNFKTLPHDWYIIVTDIKNSTKAFAEGKYKELNTIGSSTVATVINIARKFDTEIPFVYGGDGATFAVPKEMLDETLRALVSVKHHAKREYGILLRVGAVPMTDIRSKGYDVRTTKFYVVNGYPQAIFIDSGLSYAEHLVKHDAYITRKHAHKIPFQLQGLTCRFDVVPPPVGYSEIVCLIVVLRDYKKQHAVYKKVLEHITSLYGNFAKRHPINIDAVMQNMRLKSLVQESHTVRGAFDMWYVLVRAIISLSLSLSKKVVGKGSSFDFFMSATDTLKIDSRLCTIIAGNPEQREALVAFLEKEEKAGQLTFGYAVSPSTTITCLVREQEDDYINFIDGNGGGYVQAATMIKIKTGAPLDD